MKHMNLSSPPAPFLEKIDMCPNWLFCMKVNAQIFLFEAFSDIISNFGSVDLESDSTFWNISIFGAPSLNSLER